MDKNVCHFIPYHKDYHSIHTINFVLETKEQEYTSLKSQAVYKMHLVCGGEGKVHTAGKSVKVKKGDVFFTFPANPFCIESQEEFSYMYISFLGTRANMIMDNLKISPQNFCFYDCEEIIAFWENGISSRSALTDLISESILLYSFHFIGSKIIPLREKASLNEDISLKVKKYIDDNFSQQTLSLKTISDAVSYSAKYISSVFKKNFKVGVIEYLNTVRIQNACTLLQQGFTSIGDVSGRCGYSDAQYFSKVFRQKMGVSPKMYIKQL